MKIDYTLHSHTFRCGHAVGDIEDYVSLAVEQGYKIYGVADHVFLPGVYQPTIRGDYSLLDEYIKEFNRVKEKYQDSVEMFLGFECEYSDDFVDYYRSLLEEKGFHFLICGQHMRLDKQGFKSGYFGKDLPLDWSLATYKKDIVDAMKSGLFLYIAHPDLFFVGAHEVNDQYKKMTQDVIEVALQNDAVLEINVHGFLRTRHHKDGEYTIEYPALYFWQEVAKTSIRVVCGGDFHNPNEIGNKKLNDQLEELIKKSGIQLADIREVYTLYKDRLRKIL